MIFFPDIYYDIIIYRLLILYNLSSKVFSMFIQHKALEWQHRFFFTRGIQRFYVCSFVFGYNLRRYKSKLKLQMIHNKT